MCNTEIRNSQSRFKVESNPERGSRHDVFGLAVTDPTVREAASGA